MIELIVKFRRKGDSESQRRQLERILGSALLGVEPLFPGDTLDALATIYQLRVTDAAPVDQLLSRLSSEADVEYAHVPATRVPA